VKADLRVHPLLETRSMEGLREPAHGREVICRCRPYFFFTFFSFSSSKVRFELIEGARSMPEKDVTRCRLVGGRDCDPVAVGRAEPVFVADPQGG
jgi:hypothetical protein